MDSSPPGELCAPSPLRGTLGRKRTPERRVLAAGRQLQVHAEVGAVVTAITTLVVVLPLSFKL